MTIWIRITLALALFIAVAVIAGLVGDSSDMNVGGTLAPVGSGVRR